MVVQRSRVCITGVQWLRAVYKVPWAYDVVRCRLPYKETSHGSAFLGKVDSILMGGGKQVENEQFLMGQFLEILKSVLCLSDFVFL